MRMSRVCLLITTLMLGASCGGDDSEEPGTGESGGSGGEGGSAAAGEGGAGAGEGGAAAGEGGAGAGEGGAAAGEGGAAAGEGGGSGGAGAPGAPECDPEAATACQNETDCPPIEDGTTDSAANTCGFMCLASDDRVTCTTECFVETAGMTEECSTCYAEVIECVAENCFAPCAEDRDSEECATCQEEAGCGAAFYECSGLVPSP